LKKINKIAAVGAIGILGVTVLAGCSSSDESATDTATSSEVSQMLPPVIITADQMDAAAVVGDMIDIVVDDPVNTVIAVDNADVLEITQGYDDGSAIFNPGAKALAAGTATITVTNPDGSTRNIVVVVS
jgi:outer membrane murein-binding lipoprotein Lpp